MRRSLALLAALLAMNLTSCAIGDGTTSGSRYGLVGTWVSATSGSSNDYSYVDTVKVTYSANGRYFESYYYRETSGGSSDVTTSTQGGTWMTSGNELYTTYPTIDGDVTDTAVYSIHGDRLTTTYLGDT